MLELECVCVEHPRGGPPVLDLVDLAVGRGEAALLGGAAGAGASTLLSVLLGEVEPASGRVALLGRDLRRLRRASLLRLRRRVGVVPQDLRLLGEATALTNVLLPLDIDHVPRRAAAVRAAEALGRVGLATELEVRVDRLSMAERQRVALARALVREPAVLLADQPTAHQDEAHATAIARVLGELAAAGATVLVASRDPVLARSAAAGGWRRLELAAGRLSEPATAVPAAPVTSELVAEADIVNSERIPNVVPFPASARTRGVG